MSSALELLIMHHENMRVLYPDDELMVLCECENTLYDRRVLTLHALRSFDRAHDTAFFSRVGLEQLPVPLPDIEALLGRLSVPYGISNTIAEWYRHHLWDMDGVRHAHRPLANVLKVLTCLQMQDRTHIGLCDGRNHTNEETFADMVTELGRSSGLSVDRDAVFLDDACAGQRPHRMLRAWHHFRDRGYRLIAVIDGRTDTGHPQMVNLDTTVEVLFLQSRAVREMRHIDVAPQALAEPNFMLWDMLNARWRTQAGLETYNRSLYANAVQAAAS